MSVIAKAPVIRTAVIRTATGSGFLSLMPGLFVVLWSTGFIGAKFGLPYAEPLTFLALRFSLVAAIMLVASLALGAAWPVGWRDIGHIALVGILIQATYLGGVFYGIAHGVAAGVAAPFGMTAGTLYQKRFCAAVDLRSATVIQNATAGLLMLGLALASETMHIEWRGEFVLALFWLCLVLSVGATMLLLFLLRRGAASRIGSLFYLVPPVTAFMAYLLFGETLGATALVGMAVTALAVALVNRG